MFALPEKFALHNQHWVSIGQFSDYDPHLKKLKGLPFVYESPIIVSFPYGTPGIFLLSGGRQIGKTTFLKQSILWLLKSGALLPERILFATGEVIYSADELRRLLQAYLEGGKGHSVVFIDEVNYIPEWDRAVKFIADTGLLEKCSLVLTGSDVVIIKDAMKRFPGRRGAARQANFRYYPLSFLEYVKLVAPLPQSALEEIVATPYDDLAKGRVLEEHMPSLQQAWRSYLISGGYLTAINDLANGGRIERHTFSTYWEWIVGDVLKHHKTELYLREILSGILKRYNTPVTWNALAKDLSIDHHRTVADYCDMLSQMDAIYIQPCLVEHKLAAAPKKPRKIYFTDPFIHHAVQAMLTELADPWGEALAQLATGDEELLAPYAEAAVVTHFRRKHATYYIKDAGEIDLAYVMGKKIFPIEVKWTSQLRPKDLVSIARRDNGVIAARVDRIFWRGSNLVVPVPILLMKEIG